MNLDSLARDAVDELRRQAATIDAPPTLSDRMIHRRRRNVVLSGLAAVAIAVPTAIVTTVVISNPANDSTVRAAGNGQASAQASSGDWVAPHVPDRSVRPEDEAPEPDGAVPRPADVSPEAQAKAEHFAALLPAGWKMQDVGGTVFPNGDVTQNTWFKHEDGISVLYVTWAQHSKPIDILPAEGSPDADSVGHERTTEGEFVVQSLQPGEIQLGLVRPDGRSINLAYTIGYTSEQNKPKVDAEGGPAGKLDEAALRALATEATK